MKRDFTGENFEDFLKQSADSLRMKAPDKVWQNLSKELNKKRRRFTIGLSAFLLVSSALGYSIISNLPEADLATEAPSQQTNKSSLSSETNSTANQPSTPSQPKTPVIRLQEREIEQPKAINTNNITARIIPFQNKTNPSSTDLTQEIPGNSEVATENIFTPTVVDSYIESGQAETAKKNNEPPTAEKRAAELPLTIESVVNSYKAKSRRNKFESQFYFTPTISYRKLSENKSYLRSLDRSTLPAGFPALYTSVNNNVTHKPDIGFEVGYTGKYALSKRLKIRSGLQFNVNRYDVKAFSSPLSVATIALNNGSSVQSVNTLSGYSNVQGYESNWLQNLSFQLSAPIGAEFILSENDEMAFGIGTTIQPTYVLGDRAYLITTDYKNYTQVPWLIRRWNVNTALEAFVNLQAGKTKWQIGPQVRYQLLSSFISKYPVKENLFDFGLKVGVSLNNR
ncbi:MAG: hypothetical protein EOO10_12725 [Chitinophagaceae bacterium]|nr:MAG: hypothetical protein EOO10_12725 [Chitinophagaceae bacterium]